MQHDLVHVSVFITGLTNDKIGCIVKKEKKTKRNVAADFMLTKVSKKYGNDIEINNL